MSVGILSGLLQYFPKNRAILLQKYGAEKKIVKIRFRLFYRKKKFYGRSARGREGGKTLMARPLREELSFAASLTSLIIYCFTFFFCTVSGLRPPCLLQTVPAFFQATSSIFLRQRKRYIIKLNIDNYMSMFEKYFLLRNGEKMAWQPGTHPPRTADLRYLFFLLWRLPHIKISW